MISGSQILKTTFALHLLLNKVCGELPLRPKTTADFFSSSHRLSALVKQKCKDCFCLHGFGLD